MAEDQSPPLACSLSAGELADRGRWLGRLARRARTVEPDRAGVTVRFAADDGVEAELRELAVAEAECCPFLTIEVRAGDAELELRVGGPPEARPIIDAMF
jgi:hypothetical protein